MNRFRGSSTTEARTLAEVNSFPRKINPTILHTHECTRVPQINMPDNFEKSKVVYISLSYNKNMNREEWICTSTFRDKHFYNVLSDVRPSTYKVFTPKHTIPTTKMSFDQKMEMELLKKKIISTPKEPVGPSTTISKVVRKLITNQKLPKEFFTTLNIIEPDTTSTTASKAVKKLVTNKKLSKKFKYE